MRRLLLTIGGKRCAFGCTYCFADFSQYETPPSLDEVETGNVALEGVDVIYPACDVDLFAMRKRWREIMERTIALNRSISVSTKAFLSQEQSDVLGQMASAMRARGLILKVAVSASTKSSCGSLEPRTASWDLRLETLSHLRKAGVPTCLMLKPVLADIPLEEYREMIEEASSHTSAVIVGDEYVDEARQRRRPSRSDLHGSLSSRRVNWLRDRPHWFVREGGSRLVQLAEHASECGMQAYLSDLDYMEELIPSPSREVGALAPR
jgi:DNA repair photolyase